MKLQLIFFALIFYTFFICSEPKAQPQRVVPQNQCQQIAPQGQHPTHLQIIVHAETISGLDQNNSLGQKAKHEPTSTTNVETAVNKEKQTDSDLLWVASAYFLPLPTLAYYLFTQKSTKS